MADSVSSSLHLSNSTRRSQRLLRLPVVAARVGLSATTIWRQRRAGRFPEPVRISPGCIAWHEADIEEWTASRAEVGR